MVPAPSEISLCGVGNQHVKLVYNHLLLVKVREFRHACFLGCPTSEEGWLRCHFGFGDSAGVA